MTNNENPPVAEDLQLEGTEADAVVQELQKMGHTPQVAGKT